MISVKKNFIYSIIYQLLAIFLPLITAPYISRTLGAEIIGIFSYTQSIANYFVLFAMLGVINYGNRSIAMVRDNKDELSRTFWSIYTLQLTTSILMVIAYYLYVLIFETEHTIIATIQIFYIIGAAVDISWFFFGLEEFKVTVTRNIIIKLVTTFCVFIFVKTQDDLKLYALIMTLGTLLGQLSVWPFLKKYIHFARPSFRDVVQHIRPNLVLFIPVIAVSLYKIMDKIMLGVMSNMVEVGLYENVEKIIGVPKGLVTALGTVMLPRMSNLAAKGDSKGSLQYIEKSMLFVTFMGVALTFGIAGIGPIFAPVFFGEEFRRCGELLVWISPTIIFLSWANVIRTQYLIPNKKDRAYIISVFIGAIINLIINGILISEYGALGAVIGTVAAEASIAISQTVMVKDNLDFLLYFRNGLIFVPIGILMFITVRFIGYFFGQSVFTLLLQIVIGAAIYLLLSGVYLLKKRNPIIIDFINKLIKYRRRIFK
jgi:O-antigen/teichoic acid export membrane protein